MSSYEDKANSWIERLKEPDISAGLRRMALEVLLLSLARMMDGQADAEEWHEESFIRH